MQYRVKNNILFTGWVFNGWIFCLLMLMVTSVIADSESTRYSVQKVAEQSNPWALPQRQENQPGFQVQPFTYNQPNQSTQYQSVPDGNQNQQSPYTGNSNQYQPPNQWQPQAGHFVSPRFLDSLKQQQKYYQVMPENQRYNQSTTPQYTPVRPQSGLPGQGGAAQGTYGYPLYGAGSVNPLYDAPAVSPWGSGPDVLYRGESFPLVPSEAVGGIPPMYVPSFGKNNSTANGYGESVYTDESNVFNPFTFLPR
jgi:hypothetical protein